MPLHLYFGVLFPSADVHGHVVEGHFFLQEFVHLTLNGVLIARFDEGGCVVNARHRVEVFVLTRENTAAPKVIVEQIFSMSTVGHTVINEQLQDDLDGLLTVERQVLAVAGHDLTVAL